MKVILSLKNLPLLKKGSVVTVGTFDGVHKGHQKIINQTTKEAQNLKIPAVILTFDRPPAAVLKTGKVSSVLTTLDQKIEILKTFKPDFIVVLKFTPKLAHLSADEFCKQLLTKKLAVKELVVGENFRFGQGARGNVNFLKKCGAREGFLVKEVALQKYQGKPISSTIIRSLIKSGQPRAAFGLLGRAYAISGRVVKSTGRGLRMGFPTANINLSPLLSTPKEGVYAGFCWTKNKKYPCVINVGARPTFGPGRVQCEAHLLNFNGSLYNKSIILEFYFWLRGEKRFPHPQALTAQIKHDIKRAVKLLNLPARSHFGKGRSTYT